jgi:hypothetical protein
MYSSTNIIWVIQTKDDEMGRACTKSGTEQIHTHLTLLNLTDYHVISFGAKYLLRFIEGNPVVYKLNSEMLEA